MLDSLARIDRFQRRMDKLLPEEPEPEEPLAPGATEAWSPWSVLVEYADDPVGFARLLGYELEWTLEDGTVVDYQVKVARAVVEHDQVAVKSGQKTGKTLLAILLALWWVATRPRGRVTLTSANFDLVKDPLWVEAWNVYRTARARGIDWLPVPQLDPKTGWRWPDGRTIRGISVDTAEAAAGKSGDQQLFILDEASGIEREIAEGFLGNTTGGGKVLALSNPTRTDGFFYDCFKRGREFWKLFTLRGTETPNYLSGKALVPGLALRKKLDEWKRRYGEGSPFYLIRALGEFPAHTPDAVIGIADVEAALLRWGKVPEPVGVLEMGLDVALFGDDDSAVAIRRGKVARSPEAIEIDYGVRAIVNGYDHLQVTGMLLSVMKAARQPFERVRIKIDAGGGYGTAVWTELNRLKAEGVLDPLVETYLVNVATVSSDQEKFTQLRDELWFLLRDWLQDGGVLAPDPELEAELVAPKYTPTRKGQLKVDDKATIKGTIGRSPDRADALCLAVYEPPQPRTGTYSAARRHRAELPRARD
jgi:phage terminase large subunit